MELLYKSLPVAHFKTLNATEGTMEAVVSVFNNVDAANERILEGAFTDSLKVKLPKGVWMHDWATPIAKTLEAIELLPGDERLPDTLKTLGGLYIKGQFNLETQRGREAFSDLKFGTVDEFSIGYLVTKDARDAKTGVRDLAAVNLYEWSPVLVGCNPATTLLGTKAHTADRVQALDTQTTEGNDMQKKSILIGGQAVEVKAQFLGENIENAMTYAALSRLNDALFYDVIYTAILGYWEWDIDGEEYVRTPLSKEDALANIGGACDEFKEIALKVVDALLAATPSVAVEAAKSLQAMYGASEDATASAKDLSTQDLSTQDLSTKDLSVSPRAGLKLAQHSEQVRASVQELTGRVKGILALRVKEGRTLSQATRDRLQAHYETLSSACEDMKSLLDEAQQAAEKTAENAEDKSAETDEQAVPSEEGAVPDEKAMEAYSRFLELSSEPLDILL